MSSEHETDVFDYFKRVINKQLNSTDDLKEKLLVLDTKFSKYSLTREKVQDENGKWTEVAKFGNLTVELNEDNLETIEDEYREAIFQLNQMLAKKLKKEFESYKEAEEKEVRNWFLKGKSGTKYNQVRSARWLYKVPNKPKPVVVSFDNKTNEVLLVRMR